MSFASISVWDLNKKLTDGEHLFLVDVRELEKFGAGHIPGSISITWANWAID